MLTYNLVKNKKSPLYVQLYECIKKDIESGDILAHQKLPSKRSLAEHHSLSIMTVQNAYLQLFSEGYIYTQERRGYFASEIPQMEQNNEFKNRIVRLNAAASDTEKKYYRFDISQSSMDKKSFPFALWSQQMREVMRQNQDTLLEKLPPAGLWALRKAISEYLLQNRRLYADPNTILIGAGTEYLYALLAKLLGRDAIVAVENPGYGKITTVYTSEGLDVKHIPLDSSGLSVDVLAKSPAHIVHLSPAHNFPTGIVMPIARRMDILEWAKEKEGRYIIEDDYDSEFRFASKPLPSLFSKDMYEKTIYMNTFSKTLAPTLRISYMILPPKLMEKYTRDFSFHSCPVCGFEQHILANFISKGYFERHINRMRKKYKQQRDAILQSIQESELGQYAEIREELSGLHFVLYIKTTKKESEIKQLAQGYGVKLSFLSEFYMDKPPLNKGEGIEFLVNYAGIEPQSMAQIMKILAKILGE